MRPHDDRRDGTAPAGGGRASRASPTRTRTERAALVAGVLAVLTLASTPGAAQEGATPSVSFDAFGTLGAVYSTEDRADFIWNIFRPDGPGHSEEFSPDVDSRLGAQVTARLTPELTAVVQAVAEQNDEDNYAPEIEWAYLDYAVTPEFTVRAGRTPLPTFMVSEYRKVSFANPWIRPPVELYGMSPVFSSDGIDLSYQLHLGDWTNTVQVAYGWTEQDLQDMSSEATNAWNLTNTLRRGGLTLRAGFATGLLTIEGFEPFFDSFRLFGPEGIDIADRYEVSDTPFEFGTVGAEYDAGPWFVLGEAAWSDFHSVLGEKLAGYVTGGLRVGPVTPYATYARVGALSETSAPGLTVGDFPPGPIREGAMALNAALNEILRSTVIQQSLALGGRWDVRSGIALKAQVDLIDVLQRSPGTFGNLQPGYEPGGSAQLVSLATTFVF